MDEINVRQNSLKIVTKKISSVEKIVKNLDNFSLTDIIYLRDDIKKELIDMDKYDSINQGKNSLDELFYFNNELCLWIDDEPIKLKDIKDELIGEKVFRTIAPFNNHQSYMVNGIDPLTVIPYVEIEYIKLHELYRRWRIILSYVSGIKTNLARPTLKEVKESEKIKAEKYSQYFKTWKKINPERYDEYKKAGYTPTEFADKIINDFKETDFGFRPNLIDTIGKDLEYDKVKKKPKKKK